VFLCSHLSGWARQVIRTLKKKEKLRLASIIEDLEALDEVRPLSTHEIKLKSQSNADIERLLKEEEIKWYQRSKSQLFLKGTRMRGTYTVLPTAGTRRNVFMLSFRMKVPLKAKSISNLTLLIITPSDH
jgi:hypothetical protein